MIRKVRRTAWATFGLVGVLAASAFALSYKTGIYVAGNPNARSGLHMSVRSGSFTVQVIRYPERCEYGSQTITDYFTFKTGTRASLTGRIASSGSLSGRYAAFDGSTSVHGHITGNSATVTGAERSPYNPASTVQPNFCQGSRTFRARLSSR